MSILSRNYDPAIGSVGGKDLISDLSTSGATTGQVPTYNGTTVVWGTVTGSVSLTSAHILVGNGSNLATSVAISGDATISNTGAVTIANNAITTAKIVNNSVDGTKIALASQVTGSIMYYNGTDWIQLAPGTTGQVLTIAGGVPTWA